MKEAKIFEGCKHPELIDEYIRGVKEGAKQSQLQALKEEVRKLLIDRPCDEEDEGRNQAIGIVLNLITNFQKK